MIHMGTLGEGRGDTGHWPLNQSASKSLHAYRDKVIGEVVMVSYSQEEITQTTYGTSLSRAL